jgi:hypothetical protein
VSCLPEQLAGPPPGGGWPGRQGRAGQGRAGQGRAGQGAGEPCHSPSMAQTCANLGGAGWLAGWLCWLLVWGL